MASRKRGRQEMEVDAASQPQSTLDQLRNMWEFANLMQYLFTFGKAVRVDDDFGVDDLEVECLKSVSSEKLPEIGLALLKFVSSHRGLTLDLFDEYTRRQYQSKLPTRNPFGDSDVPNKFADFDAFTKIRVLWQLSQWTMIHSERVRERMSELRDTDQTYWRIEPTGWDAEERSYFLLDDNRLYRRTDPPPPPLPPAKPKKNSKKAKAAAKANKRRKISEEVEQGVDEGETEGVPPAVADDGFGGMRWECLAITLPQYKEFMESIRRSRDPNEKTLYKRCVEEILPVVEKAEEERQRKLAKKQKELLNMEKLATAKRSSRIAGKMEKVKAEELALEAERKRKADLVVARKEQERLNKLEQDRESRILTREQRLREREMRRILHEEELATLSADTKKLEQGEGRMSERHLKAEVEKRKRALEELAQEKDWIFDCSGCGVHGENLDDGTGIIACEKCNVWQHLRCVGLSKETAEQPHFQFVCSLCKRREADKEKSAKNPIKLDFRKLGPSTSPPSDKPSRANGEVVDMNGEGSSGRKRKASDDYSPAPSVKKSKHDDAATKVAEAPKGRKRKASDDDSHAPFVKKSKYDAAAEVGSKDVSHPYNETGNGTVPAQSNKVSRPSGLANEPLAIGSDLTLLPNGEISSTTAISATIKQTQAAHHSLQESINGAGPSSEVMEIGAPGQTARTHLHQTTPNGKGLYMNFVDHQRPCTPTVGSTKEAHKPTPSDQVQSYLTGTGLPRAAASPASAIFAPPRSSLGYSPTKHPSPSSPATAYLSSPNGVSLLPPSTTDALSPTKRSTSNGGVLNGGTPVLAPGPALSPSPSRKVLTPPHKKTLSSTVVPPATAVMPAAQTNGHHFEG